MLSIFSWNPQKTRVSSNITALIQQYREVGHQRVYVAYPRSYVLEGEAWDLNQTDLCRLLGGNDSKLPARH